MNTQRIRAMFVTLGTGLALAGPALAGVTDSSIKTPSNYNTFLPPSVGGTYQDPAFGTTIKRVSNVRGLTSHASGGPLTWALAEYATPSVFNNDNSRFLLQHDGYFAVYDGNAGSYLKDATYEMTANTQPRWSRTDNNVVYYQLGNQLKSYNVATGAVATVHAFSEYGAISGNGESDISWDGDHFVLNGDNRQIFVYTLSTGQKSQVLNTNGNPFDSMYIAADNKVTVTWNAVGTGRYHGIELFDSNMNFLRQLTQSGGHMDMSRDTNGDPVLVWTNANDPAAICQNGIVKIRLSDGKETCVAGLQLDWSLAVHISGSDQGWAVVSTYAPGDPQPGGNWPAYTNEVFRMKLDGSVVERLAHHRSRPHNSYNWQAWATINRDGTRILYNSNYHLQALQGAPTEYSDVYMMTVDPGNVGATPAPTQAPTVTPTAAPSATPTSGAGATPTTAPPTATPTSGPTTPTATSAHIEETDPAVKLTGTWMTQTNGVHSAGSAALAMDNTSDATVTFTGTGITWRGVMDPWCGQADVYMDGQLQKMVDDYSATEKDQFAIYSFTGLSNGTHTLRIHVRGTKQASSGGAWVWVDSFDIVSGGGSSATPTSTPQPTVPRATPTSTVAPTATPTTAPPTSTPTTVPPTATPTSTAPVATPTTAPTTAPTTTHLEQTNTAVKLTGSWFTQSNGVHSGGSAALAMDNTSDATVTFNGTGITWRGVMDPWSGQADVYLDGQLQKMVDTYAAAEKDQFALYALTGLPNASHTLRIHVRGTRQASSGGAWVWVDAFDVVSGGGGSATPQPTVPPVRPTATSTVAPPTSTPTTVPPRATATATPQPTATSAPVTTRVEDTDAAVKYTGSWFPNTNGVHSGGRAIGAMDANSRATLTFTGTGIRWIGYRDQWSGIARVLVDGVDAGTVDTFSKADTARTVLFSKTGLSSGAHVITIVATGTRSSSSSGAWVWVDAFEVVR